MCLNFQFTEDRDLVSQSFICVRPIYWVLHVVRQKPRTNMSFGERLGLESSSVTYWINLGKVYHLSEFPFRYP